MVLKSSFRPASRWMRCSPKWWWSSSAVWRSWRLRSTWASVSLGAYSARMGRELTNRPTIWSTPGTSAGRPETVVPKMTSRFPVSCPSISAQTPWTSVPMDTPSSAARFFRARASSNGSGTSTWPTRASSPPSAGVSEASRVGSPTPSISLAQAAAAALSSRRDSQRKNSRYSGTRGCSEASPPEAYRYARSRTSRGKDQPSKRAWCTVSTSSEVSSASWTSEARSIGGFAGSNCA